MTLRNIMFWRQFSTTLPPWTNLAVRTRCWVVGGNWRRPGHGSGLAQPEPRAMQGAFLRPKSSFNRRAINTAQKLLVDSTAFGMPFGSRTAGWMAIELHGMMIDAAS